MSHFVSIEPVVIRLDEQEIEQAVTKALEADPNLNADALRKQLAKEWMSIKPKLSAGQKGELNNALIDVDMAGGEKEETDVKVRFGSYITALARIAICDWYLEDDHGQPIPFNRNNIANFDTDDPLYDKVLGEIGRRNPFAKAKPSGASA